MNFQEETLLIVSWRRLVLQVIGMSNYGHNFVYYIQNWLTVSSHF